MGRFIVVNLFLLSITVSSIATSSSTSTTSISMTPSSASAAANETISNATTTLPSLHSSTYSASTNTTSSTTKSSSTLSQATLNETSSNASTTLPFSFPSTSINNSPATTNSTHFFHTTTLPFSFSSTSITSTNNVDFNNNTTSKMTSSSTQLPTSVPVTTKVTNSYATTTMPTSVFQTSSNSSAFPHTSTSTIASPASTEEPTHTTSSNESTISLPSTVSLTSTQSSNSSTSQHNTPSTMASGSTSAPTPTREPTIETSSYSATSLPSSVFQLSSNSSASAQTTTLTMASASTSSPAPTREPTNETSSNGTTSLPSSVSTTSTMSSNSSTSQHITPSTMASASTSVPASTREPTNETSSYSATSLPSSVFQTSSNSSASAQTTTSTMTSASTPSPAPTREPTNETSSNATTSLPSLVSITSTISSISSTSQHTTPSTMVSASTSAPSPTREPTDETSSNSTTSLPSSVSLTSTVSSNSTTSQHTTPFTMTSTHTPSEVSTRNATTSTMISSSTPSDDTTTLPSSFSPTSSLVSITSTISSISSTSQHTTPSTMVSASTSAPSPTREPTDETSSNSTTSLPSSVSLTSTVSSNSTTSQHTTPFTMTSTHTPSQVSTRNATTSTMISSSTPSDDTTTLPSSFSPTSSSISDLTTTTTSTMTQSTTSSSTSSSTLLSETTNVISSNATITLPTSTKSLYPSTTSTASVSSSPVPDCRHPPNVDNSEVVYNSTTVGSIASFYCLPGYTINGTDYIECLRNGKWEQPLMECLLRDCGKLGPFPNADVTFYPRGTSHFGTVAVLQCHSGYFISNPATFRCSDEGKWTGNFSVSCTAVECDNLAQPANGVLSPHDVTAGSVVTYSCNDGFTLRGFQSRICLNSGEWSGRSPTCTRIPAKPVPPCSQQTDSRGLMWDITIAGQIVSLSCSTLNKNLSGEITRKCTDNGIWLLPHYNCVRKEIEAIKNAVDTIKDNPTENTVGDVLDQLSTLTTQSTGETTYSGDIQTISSTLEAIADINYENISLTESQSQAFLETTSNLLDSSNTESWQSIDQESSTDEDVSGASKVLNVVTTYTEAIAGQLNDSVTNRTISVSNIRSSRYSAIIYKNLTGVLSPKASFNRSNLELGSSVMTIKLDQWDRVDNFTIRMTFRNFKQDNVLATCSYRNESRTIWESDGCAQRSFNSTMTVCECDHLTNFAILMSPWTKDNVDTTAIRIISIVGCSVSALGLLITIVTHIIYWRYVKSDRVKILMNLCLALLISYALFLGGVDRTENKDVCTAMAVFLQYIYLVVFFLMLAEGVEISVIVLYVFTTKSRLKWILPCAWLMPALIVGISLGATQTEGYGNEQFCWLSVDTGLIWAFVGPALLVIVVNFVLMGLILRAIFRTKNLVQKSNKERTIAGVRCICVLLPLVGCTWVIGIFYVNESMAWIQYVFAVCNSLQGLVIFIFHCALNSQLRQAYNRKQKLSGSTSFTWTRSSSNPLIIPRPKTSLSTFDNDCIQTSFGTESTTQRRRPFYGEYGNRAQVSTNIEMTRFKHTFDYFDD